LEIEDIADINVVIENIGITTLRYAEVDNKLSQGLKVIRGSSKCKFENIKPNEGAQCNFRIKAVKGGLQRVLKSTVHYTTDEGHTGMVKLEEIPIKVRVPDLHLYATSPKNVTYGKWQNLTFVLSNKGDSAIYDLKVYVVGGGISGMEEYVGILNASEKKEGQIKVYVKDKKVSYYIVATGFDRNGNKQQVKSDLFQPYVVYKLSLKTFILLAVPLAFSAWMLISYYLTYIRAPKAFRRTGGRRVR